MKHKYLVGSLLVALLAAGSGYGAAYGWSNYSSTHGEIETHTNNLNVAKSQKVSLEKKPDYTTEGTENYNKYQAVLHTIDIEQAKVDELTPKQHAYISAMAWPFSITCLLSIGALIGIQDMRTSEKHKEDSNK